MPPLWIAIRLPDLPLESLHLVTKGPAAVFERHAQRRRILCCNRAAHALGVAPGQEVGAATALATSLHGVERKRSAEQTALASICALAYQYSSWVTAEPTAPAFRTHGVWLEASASLKLFGGARRLCEGIAIGCQRLGYRSRLGMAETPELAAILADAGHHTLAPFAIQQLSLDFLSLKQETLDALRGCGLRTIGEVLDLPVDEFAARFSQHAADYLGHLGGRLPDVRHRSQPPLHYRRHLEFDGEMESTEGLLFPLRRLTLEFQDYLYARDIGVREFTLTLHHPAGASTAAVIGMARACRASTHLLLLMRERLSRLTLPAPVRALTLTAERFTATPATQLDVFTRRNAEDEGYDLLFDRLRARLGDAAVCGLRLADDYRPERSWAAETCGDARPDTHPDTHPVQARRPLWLLPAPRPIAGFPHCASDPERIESGWWEDLDTRREYHVVGTAAGATLWVYRDLQSGRWYLHGLWS